MSAKKLSRRDFLTTGTGAAAVGLMAGGTGSATGEFEKPQGRVVLVRDPTVLRGDGRADPKILRNMLNRGVAATT